MLFFKKNFEILFFYFASLAGVFSFVTILPTLLKANFDFPTSSLSFGTTLFILFFTLGNLYYTNYVDKKVDIVSMTIKLFIIDLVSMILMIIIFTGLIENDDVVLWVFYFSRILNGICGGGIATMTGYILKLKLYKTDNKERTNSIIDSSYSVIKFIMPIIGALASEWIYPAAPMYIGIALMLISIYSIVRNRAKLHFHYTINIRRSKKLNSSNILTGFSIYFTRTKYLLVRLVFISSTFIRNSARPFFEFYIPIILVSNHNLRVSEVAFVLGWMVIGVIMQPTSIFLLRKVSTGLYLLIANIILCSSILLLLFSEFIYLSIMYLSLIMFLQGYSTGMYNNWRYKLINRISNDGVKLSHITLIDNLLGGSSVYLTLIFIGLIIDTANGKGLFHDFMLIVVTLIIIFSIIEIIVDKYYNSKS